MQQNMYEWKSLYKKVYPARVPGIHGFVYECSFSANTRQCFSSHDAGLYVREQGPRARPDVHESPG
jgi:hypothetical protein